MDPSKTKYETVEKGTNIVISSNFFDFDERIFNSLREHF
jgi:hypothetical protein